VTHGFDFGRMAVHDCCCKRDGGIGRFWLLLMRVYKYGGSGKLRTSDGKSYFKASLQCFSLAMMDSLEYYSVACIDSKER